MHINTHIIINRKTLKTTNLKLHYSLKVKNDVFQRNIQKL